MNELTLSARGGDPLFSSRNRPMVSFGVMVATSMSIRFGCWRHFGALRAPPAPVRALAIVLITNPMLEPGPYRRR